MKATEFSCTVTSFRMLTPTVFETCFETHQPITFEAGQFASVIIPGAGPKGRDLRRAYSIASSPDQRPIELCVKIVPDGPGTQYLYGLRPGDKFRVMAPYGDFIYKTKVERNACFISTGTGIAPFRSMILSEKFKNQLPQNSYCFFGVRTENELLYPDLVQACPSLQFVNALSQPSAAWKGFRGRVTDYMKQQKEDFPWLETDYYLCGHGGMISEIKAFLAEKGVQKDSIHQEIYYK